MKKILTLVIVLCFISSANAIDLDFGPSVLLTNTADADTFPTIVTDGAGTWITAWHSSGGTKIGDTDIFMSCSIDNGDTWAPPIALNPNASTDSNRDFIPSLATNGFGNWVAVWHTTGGSTISWQILESYSNDNGETWTEPLPIGLSGRNAHAKIETDKAGRWLAVWQAIDSNNAFGTDWDIFFAISTDNGVTWTSPKPLNQNAGTDIRSDADPRIATDGAGTWISVWRSTVDPGGSTPITDDLIFAALSTDNGITWSNPMILNTTSSPTEGRDVNSEIATDGKGNWIVVWESSDTLGGTIGSDDDIIFSSSNDNGVTWKEPISLNSDAVIDTHYDRTPHVTTDKSGNWVVIWNSGGYIVYSDSMDNGENWKTPVTVFDNQITGDGRPQVITDGLGTWLAAWLVESVDFFRTEVHASKASSNQPPVAICKDVTVNADTTCQGSASVNNGSYDPDGDPITIIQSPTGPYGLGINYVTLTVTDNKGTSAFCSAKITVVDATSPTISLSVSPNNLWPPNHKIVLITPTITATDNCGKPSISLKSITMNEGDETNTYEPNYDSTTGYGHIINDIQVDAGGNIYLRAERAGTGSCRIYTITYTATDASGNSSNANATVIVPHNQYK